VHSFRGSTASILGPGLRFGALVGFLINEFLTINAELTVDSLNATSLPPGDSRAAGDSYSETHGLIGFSPLVAFTAGDVEIALGPKLAFWGADYYQSSMVRGTGDGTYSGLDFGGNAAVFKHVGRVVWLGGLASFDVRAYTNSCFTPSRGLERCDTHNLPTSDKVVALSALMMLSP